MIKLNNGVQLSITIITMFVHTVMSSWGKSETIHETRQTVCQKLKPYKNRFAEIIKIYTKVYN